MANVGDDVVRNILGRLPGRSLLRLRCASKHWNGLISDPHFMKKRSRGMILLPFLRPLAVVDYNEDEAHSTFRIPSPVPIEDPEDTQVSIVGTFDGIVVLALTDVDCQVILYNPLTCASKTLVVMHDPGINGRRRYIFGLGYGNGATKDDLKLVRFEYSKNHPHHLPHFKYQVLDLKTGLWSTPPQYFRRYFYFVCRVGYFLNGILYWLISSAYEILTFNVKEMVISYINYPNGLRLTSSNGLPFGSIGGCLCVFSKSGTTTFDVWLMKEESTWTKLHSFTFGLEGNCFKLFNLVCILGNGKFLMTNSSLQLVIYDTSKDSYKTFNGLATLDDFKRINTISDFNKIYKNHEYKDLRSIHYVESLVSPSDMCLI